MILNLTLIERLHRFCLLPMPIMDAFGGVVFGRVLTIAVRRGAAPDLSRLQRSLCYTIFL
ncbi:MAG TPA: hypothetical protein VGB89_06930 [Bacteroidota bacterium]